MSQEPDNLVLVYLRRIDGKIDRLTDDVQDLKHRVTSLEGRVASLEGQVASIRGDMAAMSLRNRPHRNQVRPHRAAARPRPCADADGLTGRLFRSRPEIAGPRADQHAAFILLDGMGDPADGAADDEYSERAAPRQCQ